MLSRVNKKRQAKRHITWSKRVLKDRGPVGLQLLAEVLNWDIQSVDPAKFGENEFRRHLICLASTGSIATLPNSDKWRPKLRAILEELRDDVMRLLEPREAAEKAPWLPDSQRLRNLTALLHKLSRFRWRESLGPDPLGNRRTSGSTASIGLEGASLRRNTSFDVGGEQLGVVEHLRYAETFERGVRERLYRIIYASLKSGDISKLRRCNNKQCRKFFIGKKPQCGEKCRSRVNNELRRKAAYFSERYKDQKTNRLAKAERLLKQGKLSIEKIVRLTRLTRKALERKRLI
jgi:hypothetical protein